jgi:fatty acid desaturase
MEAVAQRKIIHAIRKTPEIQDAFKVPLLALPTFVILILTLVGFGASTGFYLSGELGVIPLVLINSVIIYFSFTPLHEATHRSFSRVMWLNDVLGTASAQLILPGFNTSLYRFLHITHHQHTGESQTDPDEKFVSSPLWSRVLNWAFLDILWTRYYLSVWSERPQGERVRFCVGVFFYLSVFVVGFSSSYAVEFLFAFVVPMFLARVILVYLFAYIHHPRGVEQRSDPIGATGMIDTHVINRFLMLGQARHLIHHLYPGLPWYRYDQIWDVAREKIPTSEIRWGRFLGRIEAN